jgi:hypothetical protein
MSSFGSQIRIALGELLPTSDTLPRDELVHGYIDDEV